MNYYCRNIHILPTILILDSGVGGLSVYIKIRKILPYMRYLYFFDNQAFPYGERSEEFIVHRVISIIRAIQERHKLDLVIIACNTASVVSLKKLKNYFLFPVVGVIPAIKLASKLTKNGIIGILATKRTINNQYTLSLIKRFANKHTVVLLGTSELVNLAESKIYGEKLSISMLRKVLDPWLRMKNFPDTIVLGCTHFSLLRRELMTILSSNSYLIDSIHLVIKLSIFLLRKHINDSLNNAFYYSSNKIYCSMYTKRAMQLKYILLSHYDFVSLEILSI